MYTFQPPAAHQSFLKIFVLCNVVFSFLYHNEMFCQQITVQIVCMKNEM